jgi:hypothetical protein
MKAQESEMVITLLRLRLETSHEMLLRSMEQTSLSLFKMLNLSLTFGVIYSASIKHRRKATGSAMTI